MSRAVLSAGSNIGDPTAHLRSVVEAFADDLVAVSAVYSTPPWGGVEQEDFRNITLVVDGPHDARGWLERGFDLERAADRTREIRWGPRTLDVDVVTARVDNASAVLISPDKASARGTVIQTVLGIDATVTSFRKFTVTADLVRVDGQWKVATYPRADT